MTHTFDSQAFFEGLEDQLHWIPLGQLTGDEELACIDGRFTGCVLGAPGGDAGEFVVLVGALEKVAGRKAWRGEVERWLEGYMQRHGSFYLHSDRHAMQSLARTVSDDPELSGWLEEAGDIDALVRQPPREAQEKLRELLIEPRHVGCGHLKTMLSDIEAYGVRRELVEDTIRGFFTLLWQDGPNTANFTILEGEHAESAIIVFDSEQKPNDETLVPALCGSKAGPYFFVDHQPARRFKRQKDLDLLSQASDLVPSTKKGRTAILNAAEALADRQAEATISALAPDLPKFVVHFEGQNISVEG